MKPATAWALAAGAAVTVAVLFLWGSGPAAPPSTAAAGPPAEDGRGATAYRPAAQERAVAFGLLLDTPVAPEVIDEAIELAEALRVRYGIDTGDPQADRQEATERAMREVIDPLRFTAEDLEGAARDLGYSLDPAECANYCDNVRRLADIELRRRALRLFAESGTTAGASG